MAKILIVDDHPTNREYVVTVLRYAGHELREASDGLEGLNIAVREHPDLIIADILMPTMDGIELVRRLRDNPETAQAPVIFYTATYLIDEARAVAASCGVSHILAKPCEPEMIFHTVNEVLGIQLTPVPVVPADEVYQQHLQMVNRKLTQKLDVVIPRLAALIDLGQQLASQRDPMQLLQTFCHAARDIIGAKYAAVIILGDEQQPIRHFLTSGIAAEEVARIGLLPEGKGLFHKLLVERGAVRISDIAADSRSVGFPSHHPPMRSFLGAPILSSTQRYGSVYLTEKLGSEVFNEDDEQIILTLAAQVAVAYENAWRYDQLQHEIAERKQVQEKLKASEENYRRIVETAHEGVAVIDTDSRATLVNRRIAELFGYTVAEMIGKPIFAFLNDADQDAAYQHLAELRDGKASQFAFRLRRKDHSTFWALFKVNPFFDNEGRYQGTLAMISDITDLKAVEEELAALYNATAYLFKADSLLNLGHQIGQAVVREFEQADCGVLLVDKKQNRLIRLARVGAYSVTTDAPIYLDGSGLVPETVRTGKMHYAPNVLENSHYIANDSRTRSELVVPLQTMRGVLGVLDLQSAELNAFNERDQRILSAFATRAAATIEIMQLYEEINRHVAQLEQRVIQRTAELHNAKERVEAILNNSSDTIIVTDVEGNIHQTNPAFNQLFGYTFDEVFEQSLAKLLHPNDIQKLSDALHVIVDGQLSQRFEVIACHKDGTELDVDIALSAITTQEEKLSDIVCSVRDITARRQVEKHLRETLEKEKELNELKSRLLSMASHDFRTPLAVILSSAEMLEQHYDRMTAEQRALRYTKIRTSISQMTRLLEDVLSLTSAQEGHVGFNPTPVNLNILCRDIAEGVQVSFEKGDTIVFSGDWDAVADVIADEKLIRQIIGNLLSNAVKYTLEGENVDFNLSFGEGQAIFQIRDRGIGIPEKDQERLFEPFHRAGNVRGISGTGLGLAIVKKAVELHGGTISFESKVGIGTTFTVVLPMTQLIGETRVNELSC